MIFSDGFYCFICFMSERHLIASYISSELRSIIMVNGEIEVHLICEMSYFRHGFFPEGVFIISHS